MHPPQKVGFVSEIPERYIDVKKPRIKQVEIAKGINMVNCMEITTDMFIRNRKIREVFIN